MKSDEFVMHLKQKHGYGIKQGITAAGIESDGKTFVFLTINYQ